MALLVPWALLLLRTWLLLMNVLLTLHLERNLQFQTIYWDQNRYININYDVHVYTPVPFTYM